MSTARFGAIGFGASRFSNPDVMFGTFAKIDPAPNPDLLGLEVGTGGAGPLAAHPEAASALAHPLLGAPRDEVRSSLIQEIAASSPIAEQVKKGKHLVSARDFSAGYLSHATSMNNLMTYLEYNTQPEVQLSLGAADGTPGATGTSDIPAPSMALHGIPVEKAVEYNKLAVTYWTIATVLQFDAAVFEAAKEKLKTAAEDLYDPEVYTKIINKYAADPATQPSNEELLAITAHDYLEGVKNNKYTAEVAMRLALYCNKDGTQILNDNETQVLAAHKFLTSSIAPLSVEQLTKFRTGFLAMLGSDPEGKLPFNPEKFRAFISHMACHDLGKTHFFQDAYKKLTGKTVSGHDDILLRGMEAGLDVLIPTYEGLNEDGKRLFTKAVQAAAKLNIPQIPQGEAPLSMLASMVGLTDEEVEFFIYHVMFDAYGAKGFQNWKVPFLPAFLHPTLEKSVPHIKRAASSVHGFDPVAAYASIIKESIGERADRLDFTKPEDITIGRLMGHFPSRMGAPTAANEKLSKDQKLDAFEQAWERLTDAERQNLINAYGANGIDEGTHGLTMQYAPQIIENAFYYYADVDGLPATEALKKALDACLPFIARVCEKIVESLADRPETIPAYMVNFQNAADVIKKPTAANTNVYSPDVLATADIVILKNVDGVNVGIGPVKTTGAALDALVKNLTNQIAKLDPAKGKFKFLLDLDGTVIGSGHDDQISDEVLAALKKLSAHPHVEIHIITHSGKTETINKLLAVPGINVIGDAGGYKLAADGSVAEWYVDDKYVQAVGQYWSVFAGIVKNHLDKIPKAIRKKVTHQIKKLSQDVVYDKKGSKLVARMDPVLQAIAADIERYISENGLTELFISNIRINSDGGAKRYYWDLKVNTPVSKDMPIAGIVKKGDFVFAADDDSKHGITMHMKAYDIVGRDHAYTVFVEGNSRGPSKDPKTLSRLTHAVGGVSELDYLLIQIANSLPE